MDFSNNNVRARLATPALLSTILKNVEATLLSLGTGKYREN